MAGSPLVLPPPPLSPGLGPIADAALFLDFDGTLVEIAPRPDAVQVQPGLPRLLQRLATGLNVAGTTHAQPPTGSGQRPTAPAGPGQGVAVDVLDATLGTRGPVRSTAGVVAALQNVLTWAEGDKTSSDPATAAGAVTRARTTLTDEIKRFDDRISDFEVRLASRETTLRKKYAALESAISTLQNKSSWLSSQLG